MKKLISLFLVCLLMLSCVTLVNAAAEPEKNSPTPVMKRQRQLPPPKLTV